MSNRWVLHQHGVLLYLGNVILLCVVKYKGKRFSSFCGDWLLNVQICNSGFLYNQNENKWTYFNLYTQCDFPECLSIWHVYTQFSSHVYSVSSFPFMWGFIKCFILWLNNPCHYGKKKKHKGAEYHFLTWMKKAFTQRL